MEEELKQGTKIEFDIHPLKGTGKIVTLLHENLK